MPKTFTLMETKYLSQCNDGPHCQTVETFNKAGKLHQTSLWLTVQMELKSLAIYTTVF